MDVVFLDHRPIKMRSNITWDAGGIHFWHAPFPTRQRRGQSPATGGQPGIQHKQVEDVNTNFPDGG